MENGIAYPVALHLKGRISITDFHGSTMPIWICFPMRHKKHRNGYCLRFSTAF